MLKGLDAWWMKSLTSSRSGMMAWHLCCSHCDQMLLCSCFIVVTAWAMLGFVLPTVAIHHLWRAGTYSCNTHSLPPTHTHTYTHLHLHTVERSCHYCCFICTCTITLISLFVSYSIPMHLILWAIWVEERQNAWATSQRAAAHNERRFHISSALFCMCINTWM